MTTTKTIVNEVIQQVASGDWIIQNTGNTEVYVILSDTQPDLDSDDYFIIQPGESMSSVDFPDSTVWVKCRGGSAVTVAQ